MCKYVNLIYKKTTIVGFRFEFDLEKKFLFSKFTNQNVLKYLIDAFSAKKFFIFSSNPKAFSKRKPTITFQLYNHIIINFSQTKKCI